MGIWACAKPLKARRVRQRFAGHRDAEVGHVGEIRQALPVRLMGLAEHLPFRAVQRAPFADAPLQRPPESRTEFGMPAHDASRRALGHMAAGHVGSSELGKAPA